jgi:4'-phosphopantetheinyl transferase
MDSFQLASDEVHSWCVGLDVPPDTCAALHATLTCDELSRSARLRFERDRRRFIVAHGVLRKLLGSYLGICPGELRFVRKEFGKPRLSPAFDGRLRFNLSHSADVALIAVARDAEVGVDVERIRALPELADDPQAFLDGWTRNEAYVKATGLGLANDLVPDGSRCWSCFSLHPARGYVGALVIEGIGWRLRHHAYAPNRSNR